MVRAAAAGALRAGRRDRQPRSPFRSAGNRIGLAGERGAEAILPLARGPDGALGVRAAGGGGISVTFNVSTPDADSFRRSETQIAALLARAVGQRQPQFVTVGGLGRRP